VTQQLENIAIAAKQISLRIFALLSHPFKELDDLFNSIFCLNNKQVPISFIALNHSTITKQRFQSCQMHFLILFLAM